MNTKKANKNEFNYERYPWSPNSDMVEILIDSPDDFLKIKETLTRIGTTNKSVKNELHQLCHILYKNYQYYIVHFKEMYLIDNKFANLTYHDIERRNMIITLLSDWGLLTVVDINKITDKAKISSFKIVPFNDKENWNLISKYQF